jgi:hypothetical protein
MHSDYSVVLLVLAFLTHAGSVAPSDHTGSALMREIARSISPIMLTKLITPVATVTASLGAVWTAWPCPEARRRTYSLTLMPRKGFLEGGGGSRMFWCPYLATVFVVAVKTSYDNHEHHC